MPTRETCFIEFYDCQIHNFPTQSFPPLVHISWKRGHKLNGKTESKTLQSPVTNFPESIFHFSATLFSDHGSYKEKKIEFFVEDSSSKKVLASFRGNVADFLSSGQEKRMEFKATVSKAPVTLQMRCKGHLSTSVKLPQSQMISHPSLYTAGGTSTSAFMTCGDATDNFHSLPPSPRSSMTLEQGKGEALMNVLSAQIEQLKKENARLHSQILTDKIQPMSSEALDTLQQESTISTTSGGVGNGGNNTSGGSVTPPSGGQFSTEELTFQLKVKESEHKEAKRRIKDMEAVMAEFENKQRDLESALERKEKELQEAQNKKIQTIPHQQVVPPTAQQANTEELNFLLKVKESQHNETKKRLKDMELLLLEYETQKESLESEMKSKDEEMENLKKLVNEMPALRVQVSELETLLKQKTEECADLTRKLETATETVETERSGAQLISQIEAFSNQIDEAHHKELEKRVEELENILAEKDEKISELEAASNGDVSLSSEAQLLAELQSAQEELYLCQKKIGEQESKISTQKTENQNLKSKLEKLNSQLASSQKETETEKSNVLSLERNLLEAKQDLEESIHIAEQLESRNKDLQKENQRVKVDLANSRDDAKKTREQLASVKKELEESLANVQTLQATVEDKEGQVEILAHELTSVHQDSARLREQLSFVEKELKQSSVTVQTLQGQVEQKEAQVRKLMEELSDVRIEIMQLRNHEHETASEQLRSAMNEIEESKRRARENEIVFESLTEENVTKIQSQEKQIMELIQNVNKLTNKLKHTREEIERLEHRERILTLSLSEKESELSAEQNRVQTLRALNEDLETTHQILQDSITSLHFRSLISEAISSIQNREMENLKLENENEKNEKLKLEEFERVQKELQIVVQEKNSLRVALEDSNDKLSKLETESEIRFEEVMRERDEAFKSLESVESENARLSQDLISANEKMETIVSIQSQTMHEVQKGLQYAHALEIENLKLKDENREFCIQNNSLQSSLENLLAENKNTHLSLESEHKNIKILETKIVLLQEDLQRSQNLFVKTHEFFGPQSSQSSSDGDSPLIPSLFIPKSLRGLLSPPRHPSPEKQQQQDQKRGREEKRRKLPYLRPKNHRTPTPPLHLVTTNKQKDLNLQVEIPNQNKNPELEKVSSGSVEYKEDTFEVQNAQEDRPEFSASELPVSPNSTSPHSVIDQFSPSPSPPPTPPPPPPSLLASFEVLNQTFVFTKNEQHESEGDDGVQLSLTFSSENSENNLQMESENESLVVSEQSSDTLQQEQSFAIKEVEEEEIETEMQREGESREKPETAAVAENFEPGIENENENESFSVEVSVEQAIVHAELERNEAKVTLGVMSVSNWENENENSDGEEDEWGLPIADSAREWEAQGHKRRTSLPLPDNDDSFTATSTFLDTSILSESDSVLNATVESVKEEGEEGDKKDVAPPSTKPMSPDDIIRERECVEEKLIAFILSQITNVAKSSEDSSAKKLNAPTLASLIFTCLEEWNALGLLSFGGSHRLNDLSFARNLLTALNYAVQISSQNKDQESIVRCFAMSLHLFARVKKSNPSAAQAILTRVKAKSVKAIESAPTTPVAPVAHSKLVAFMHHNRTPPSTSKQNEDSSFDQNHTPSPQLGRTPSHKDVTKSIEPFAFVSRLSESQSHGSVEFTHPNTLMDEDPQDGPASFFLANLVDLVCAPSFDALCRVVVKDLEAMCVDSVLGSVVPSKKAGGEKPRPEHTSSYLRSLFDTITTTHSIPSSTNQIIPQIFEHIFHSLDILLFNGLLLRVDLCSMGCGLQMKLNISEIEQCGLQFGLQNSRLLPSVRQAVDVLCLPKDLLKDKKTRLEVFPTLSNAHIRQLLLSYRPDEFDPQRVSEAILKLFPTEKSALMAGTQVPLPPISNRPAFVDLRLPVDLGERVVEIPDALKSDARFDFLMR